MSFIQARTLDKFRMSLVTYHMKLHTLWMVDYWNQVYVIEFVRRDTSISVSYENSERDDWRVFRYLTSKTSLLLKL